MNAIIIVTHALDGRNSLRILKSDIGYHLELLQEGKLAFGTYFRYGERVDNVALCVGGAIYGMLHDDEISESAMLVITDNFMVFGGNELQR